MNNEGNTNINQNQVNSSQPKLMPMEGVKVVPVNAGPIDASNSGATTTVNPSNHNTNPQITNPTIVNNQVNSTNQVPVSNQISNVNTSVSNTNNDVVNNPSTNNTSPSVKKKFNLVPILLLIVVALGGYIVYSSKNYQSEIDRINYECTPITSSSKEIELDINSTLVKSLYKKVETSILEDLAQPEFNDNLKIYLAYRQILESDKYDSNCNLFNKTSMEPYNCEETTRFIPKAFSEDTMKQAIKELYGEKTDIQLQNIRLGTNSCIGGYEYIPERGEFVQGYCDEKNASLFKKEKKITKAISTGNTIIITEEVKYIESEGLTLPTSLKNGFYHYKFRLDMNYNYVLVDKTYESKY